MLTIAEKIAKMEAEQVEAVMQYFGTVRAVSHFLNISPQEVYRWRKNGRISKNSARALEYLTNGRFKVCDMLPTAARWRERA